MRIYPQGFNQTTKTINYGPAPNGDWGWVAQDVPATAQVVTDGVRIEYIGDGGAEGQGVNQVTIPTPYNNFYRFTLYFAKLPPNPMNYFITLTGFKEFNQ